MHEYILDTSVVLFDLHFQKFMSLLFLQENWVTLVQEDADAVLEWASCVNKDKLILCYLRDVKVTFVFLIPYILAYNVIHV